MATLMQNSSQPPSVPFLEPDDEWKRSLKVNIEAGLRSMVEEAKQKLSDELAKGTIGPQQRERLTADHLATLKTIRHLAEEQYRIALERERQERRWASSEQLDQAWSESMMKEQQAILDRIERERKNQATATSLQSNPTLPTPSPPQIFHPYSRPEATDPPRRESTRRRPSMSARPIVQEFWKPSIAPEEEAQVLRMFTRDNNANSEVPSALSAILTNPLDAPSSNTDQERNRPITPQGTGMGISRASDQAMKKELEAWKKRETRTREEAERRQKGPVSRFKGEPFRFMTTPPRSMTPTPPIRDSSRIHIPPPSASRPIVRKRSLTPDDTSFQSSTSSRNQTRSSYADREDSSCSPQTPEETEQSWQPSQLRGRFSSQEMQRYSQQEGNHHSHREDSEGSDDNFDTRSWRARDYTERRIQDIEEGLRKREEAANRREEELARKAEELRREDNARRQRAEEQRREEETRGLQKEVKQTGDDEHEREAKLRKKEEEADRREKEIAVKEEETRRKEEEAKKKEQEARKKEREARRKEEEVKRQEMEARSREVGVKRKDEEVKRKDEEMKRKDEEMNRREEEIRRREEGAKMMEKEARRKEQEAKKKEQEAKEREMMARQKEEETRRKEEEIRIMEEDARRKEFEARQKQEAHHRLEETSRKAEEIRKKEEDLQKREREFMRKEKALNRRATEMRRREIIKLQEDFRRGEAEEGKKQAVWATWPLETSAPPQALNSPGHDQKAEERKKQQEIWQSWLPEIFRSAPSQMLDSPSPPGRDQKVEEREKQEGWKTWRPETFRSAPPRTLNSPSPSGRDNPISDWSSASPRRNSTTSTQLSSLKGTQLTEPRFHLQRTRQRGERFGWLANQEYKAKAGEMMSEEEATVLLEAHRSQWDKIQTVESLVWEDFPWPMFELPKGPDDLTPPAIIAYILSSMHPQDTTTKERIEDNVRKWQPDRFNSQLLPKVREKESRGHVSEGVRLVARTLKDLLYAHS